WAKPDQQEIAKLVMTEEEVAAAAAIEVISSSIDGSLVFHVVYDVIAFLLYTHEQIPA
ncbi:hypothetical protein Dimus_015785, partial [Dionaea muscipula]